MALIPALLLLVGIVQTPESQADFDKRLDNAFTATGLPGGGVRVIKDGKVLYDRAFGVADVDTKQAATTKMAFEIGSLSKQFTAVCLLMLVQEGKVGLSDTLGKVIPEVPAAWQGATVDQILHHMSGIPDYEAIATYDFYNEPRKNQEIIDQAAKEQPAFKPGEKFDYSNTGYYLISMIVEKRSGMSMGQFLRKRVFSPLGMNSSYSDDKPSGVVTMTGYHSRTGARKKQPPIAWSSTLGAGGIVCTLDDLMKWDEALYSDKLVRKDLLEKIWTPTKLNDGKINQYGYGWFSTTFRGTRELNHSGQTNGFTCIYRRYPELHASVWSFTNTYSGGGVFGIARSAMYRYLPSLSYASLPIPSEQNAAKTQEHLNLVKIAISGKGELDHLTASMRDFATSAGLAETRKQVQALLDAGPDFQLLKITKRTIADGLKLEDHLYRQKVRIGCNYWTISISDGKLAGLFVEVE